MAQLQETSEEMLLRRARVSSAFSPAAPINSRDLFAGRAGLVRKLIDVIFQRGQHGILFGERGVGKTSLASVIGEFLAGTGSTLQVHRINCDRTDDYDSVWRKMFERITLSHSVTSAGFNPRTDTAEGSVAELLPADVPLRPSTVLSILSALSRTQGVVIFFDEFDRLPSVAIREEFGDTIKALSDDAVNATLVVVGVSDSVDELISGHESIARALVQLRAPRMSQDELYRIADDGFQRAGLAAGREVIERIAQLSHGLPHYTHLLGQQAAYAAVEAHSDSVEQPHLTCAVEAAIENAQEMIRTSYHRAIFSTRQTLYPQVLLACAMTPCDDRGFFAPGDVRDPLAAVLKQPCGIERFSSHLHDFSSEERGCILLKEGQPRRYRYRFENPLMQPYVLMRGIQEGLIAPAQVARIYLRRTQD